MATPTTSNSSTIQLLALFDHHIDMLQSGADKNEMSKATLTKYRTVRKKLSMYIQHAFNKEDIPLSDASNGFLNDFHHYLVFDQHLTHNTAVRYIEFLEKIFRGAVDDGVMDSSKRPEYLYSRRKVTNSDYLTIDELRAIEILAIKSRELAEIQKLFLFSCYTGAGLKEMATFTTEDIVAQDSEDDLWLAAEGVEHFEIRYVPLTLESEEVIGWFEGKRIRIGTELLFPVRIEDDPALELNEIAQLAGITKPITFDTAMNTFYFSFSQFARIPESSFERLKIHHDQALGFDIEDDLLVVKPAT